MGRHRERPKGHWYLYSRPDSSFWWVYCYDKNNPDKRIYRPTKRRKSDYTRTQMERLINTVQGIVRTDKPGGYSVSWFESYTMRKLKIEGLEENTIIVYQRAFMHLRNLYGSEYSILNIRREDIDRIKEYLIEQGQKPNSINNCLRTLRAAFQRLYDDERIDKNPLLRFKPVRDQENRNKKKHLSLSELRDFINFCKQNTNEETYRLIRIYSATGRRRNEILYLQNGDVDIERGIYRPLDIKSKDKHRITRSIPENVSADFDYFLKKYPNKPYPFKICHEHTMTHRVINMFRTFGKRKTGNNENEYNNLNLHSLRHTYLTALENEMGYTDREIQLIIGHSDRMTTRGYLHTEIEKSPTIAFE